MVKAPPGGLQLEMQDMSGDNVSNDLVLTSRLMKSQLVVLLNDRHDNLTVAISPGEGQAAGSNPAYHAVGLRPPRINAGNISNRCTPGPPHFKRGLLPAGDRIPREIEDEAFSLGRAPPVPAHN